MLEIKLCTATTDLITLTDPAVGLVEDYTVGGTSGAALQNEDTTGDVIQLALLSSAIDTSVVAINKALALANDYDQDRIGEPIYLMARRSSGHAWKRSRIINGALSYNVSRSITADHAPATLTITRQNWFEGDEVAVPLTNPNGNRVTTSLNLFGCNDLTGTAPNKRACYADIDGADILGDLPAPANITFLINNMSEAIYGIGASYDRTMDFFFEGELQLGETPVADASCSGGAYTVISGVSGLNFGTSAAKANGLWFIPVLRARPKVANQLTKIRQDREIVGTDYYLTAAGAGANFGLYILDPMKVPEYKTDISLLGLWLTATADLMDIDFVALVPAEGWRHIKAMQSTPSPMGFLDNPYDEKVTIHNGLDAGVYTGPGCSLKPGLNQRFVCFSQLGESGEGSAWIDRAGSLTIKYRPRYRTL